MGDRHRPAAGRPAEAGDFLLERRHRVAADWLPQECGTLLDYGCGNGAQTLFFVENARRLIGVDISSAGLDAFARAAEQQGLSDRLELHRGDGATIPVPTESVDVLTSFEVLEHVQDEDAVLTEMLRVLKPGGTAILSVPNRWWILETHGADLPLLPWNRVPLFSWLPKRIHDRWARARIYRRREIVERLTWAGFRVERAEYLTAPLDVLRWERLRSALRRTLFRNDLTACPCAATAVILRARRPRGE